MATFALLYFSWFVSNLIGTTSQHSFNKGHVTILDIRQLGRRNRKKLSYSFLYLFCSKDMRYNVQFRSKSAVL